MTRSANLPRKYAKIWRNNPLTYIVWGRKYWREYKYQLNVLHKPNTYEELTEDRREAGQSETKKPHAEGPDGE